MSRVYLVTGGNRGIGLEVVKELCKQKVEQDNVYLTARNSNTGMQAVNKLVREGLDVKFHKLDITSKEDAEELAEYLKTKYGGLDVLVNNAGIAFKNSSADPFSFQAQVTVGTNYFGTLNLCNALFPILKPGGRVVNVSSSCGHLSKINGAEPQASLLRERLSSPQLTVEQLSGLMNRFIKAAEEESHCAEGWPNSAYKVSKVGVSALTVLQQRMFNQSRPGDDIAVNHAHPGYVATEMTSYKGHWDVEKGCRSIVYAATLPPHSGVFGEYIWEDGTTTSWIEAEVNLFYD